MSDEPGGVPAEQAMPNQTARVRYRLCKGFGSSSEPDANGDFHSNCHTGSKGRGAGGDDKPGSKKG
jgi:hypothetical protein